MTRKILESTTKKLLQREKAEKELGIREEGEALHRGKRADRRNHSATILFFLDAER